jgi:hypothetical protein
MLTTCVEPPQLTSEYVVTLNADDAVGADRSKAAPKRA